MLAGETSRPDGRTGAERRGCIVGRAIGAIARESQTMSKLPFIPGLFFKTLVVVVVLVVGTWWAVLALGLYDEMTPADYGGSFISTILLAYLIHLWLMPVDDYPEECEDETD